METIAAISTPNAPGGIGVIRISGEKALVLADGVFVSAGNKVPSCMAGYTCAYGYIQDENGNHVDDVVLTVFRSPHSYTGEDVVEISCHGGIFICRKIVALLYSKGASPAAPGEFTKRAFLNGKMSLSQAEAVMHTIQAQGEVALREANLAKNGRLSKEMRRCRDRLTELISAMSYWMDDAEEAPDELAPQRLCAEMTALLDTLHQLSRRYDDGRIYRSGIRTALMGAPNAGKSSVMNWLAGMQRSIVTNIPGTTRDVITESVRLGDFLLLLSDTAGLRQTGDVIEAMGVDAAYEQAKQADLILYVVDSCVGMTENDRAFLTADILKKTVIIYNKCDASNVENQSQEMNGVICSAKYGKGYDALVDAIAAHFVGRAALNQPALVSQRQKSLVDRAACSIQWALNGLECGETIDICCMELENAANILAEFDGENVTDDIIDGVFSRFCVGK